MFTFEVFTLDRETRCHNVELYCSKESYSQYNIVLADGVRKAVGLSIQIPNTLIELNIWDDECEEWVKEIVFENGIKID